MAKNNRKTWVTCVMCGVVIKVEVCAVEVKGKENFICETWCKGGNDDNGNV